MATRSTGAPRATQSKPVPQASPPTATSRVMTNLGIEFSQEVEQRCLKIMFWGATSTRKTETVARNFPNLLLIDTEGNSDQIVRSPHVPPFVRVKTQDPRKVLEVLEAAQRGQITLKDSSPIMTVCIDSVSVLWTVQQEVASSLAEQRLLKRAQNGAEVDVSGANATVSDWNKAKRPLRAILNRFSKGAIPILVLIAREKDLYQELPSGDLKKTGVTPNAVKDTEYDMNLSCRFFFEGGKWMYEVTKVQGELNTLFQMGSRNSVFPVEKLLTYAESLKPQLKEESGEDENLPDSIAASIMAETAARTSQNLIKYAQEKGGYSAKDLGSILKSAGFNGFDPAKWEGMVAAVDHAVEEGLLPAMVAAD